MQEEQSPDTPLQRRLDRLARQISVGVVLACLAFLVSGLLRGQPWEITAVAAVALAVAAVPDSLPAVVTLALAGGASRMSRRGAVVRTLPAVETLGSVTLLATDKTGTLTRGAMVADRWWTREDGDQPLDGPSSAAGRALLEAAVLCNDADPTGAGAGGTTGTADTETSLVRAALRGGIDVAALRAGHPRLREEPFDAVTRRMATEHRDPGGRTTTITKGAPEAVLPGLGGARGRPGRWSTAGRRTDGGCSPSPGTVGSWGWWRWTTPSARGGRGHRVLPPRRYPAGAGHRGPRGYRRGGRARRGAGRRRAPRGGARVRPGGARGQAALVTGWQAEGTSSR